MPPQPQTSPKPTREEKIQFARCSFHNASSEDFDLLISLLADADPDIGGAAHDALARLCEHGTEHQGGNAMEGGNAFGLLSDTQCARLLSSPGLPAPVLRYFLHPSQVRPALLPAILAHPACPQDAVTALAAEAGPDVIAALLEHLDLLKTTALEALKQNPAAHKTKMHPSAAASAVAFLSDHKLSVAQGEVKLADTERLPTLVALASDADPEVSREAQDTLRLIPDNECLIQLVSPTLSETVARYFLDPAHVRPALLTVLLDHPSSPPDAITSLAAQAGPEALAVLLDQLDLLKTPALRALKENPAYLEWQAAPPTEGFVLEVDLLDMLIAEIEAGNVSVIAGLEEELEAEGDERKSESTTTKIAKMSVAKKVVLALRGNREERAILIRDGSKVVTRAVLGSPKITDPEIESFAAAKNVSQDVLRLISMSRKFMKNYVVMKNLVGNPRCPIDVGLNLITHLLPQDVRAVSANRDVSEVVRKMATKLTKTRGH